TGIPMHVIAGVGKERQSVRARSLLCFWGARELGLPLTDLAGRLGVSVPTVSVAVQRGAKIVDRESLKIAALLNVKL
ncbi:MAG: helix-turn-helix transcriptional regulator, partial [Syntrophobacter sp.]